MQAQPDIRGENRIGVPRALRVNLPVLISFATNAFTVRQFAINLSESGIFVPTDKPVAKGIRGKFKTSWIPWATFTDPEVARIGMTEAEAAEHGGRVAELPLAEMDRAITDGRTEGFVKLIAGPKLLTRNAFGGQMLGATIVAPRAGEMIHEIALAMRMRAFTGRIAQTVHAYPTWSFAVRRTAGQFFGDVDGREARPARK